MKTIFRFVAAVALLVLTPLLAEEARATQIFADQTGKNCDHCHVGRPDDLEFTADGNLFVQNYYQFPSIVNGPAKSGMGALVERSLRRLLLAVHAAAAVALAGAAIFFGFVARPLAREDLPAAERKFLWVSMGLAIGCGVLLVPFVFVPGNDFWHSRYGTYLGLKIVLTNMLVLLVTIRLIVARQTAQRRKEAEAFLANPDFARFKVFSSGDLKLFNGRKGRRALIALKGKVYEVTGSGNWQNGLHLNKHSAGADLTGAIAAAPHGEAVLKAVKEVGTYDAAMTASGSDELRRLEAHVRRFDTVSWASAAVAAALAVTLAFWHS